MVLKRLQNQWMQLQHRLQYQLDRSRQLHAQRLQQLDTQLQAQNPKNILQKGYAWVETPDGAPIVNAHQLTPKQPIVIQWADGQAQAQIDKIKPNEK